MVLNLTLNHSIQYSLIGGACHLTGKILGTETLSIDSKKRRSLKIVVEITGHIANLIFVYSCVQNRLRFVGGVHYTFWSSFALVTQLVSYVAVSNGPTQNQEIEDNPIVFFSNVFFAIIDVATFSLTATQFLNSKCDVTSLTIAMGLHVCNQLFEKINRSSIKWGSLLETRKSALGIEEIKGENGEYYEGRKGLIKDLLSFISLNVGWRNALLIGPPGCGKTQLIKHLAWLIEKGQVSADLQGSRVFNLSTSAFTTGCSYVGTVEGRIDEIFAELNKVLKTLHPGKAVVFIDEIWQLIGAGQGMHQTTDVAGRLLTLIEENPKLVLIGATTPAELPLIVDRSPAFADRFQGYLVPDLTLEEKMSMAKACLNMHKNIANCLIPEKLVVEVMNTELKGTSCREIMKTIPLALAYMQNDTNDSSEESVSARFRNAVSRARQGNLQQLKLSVFF